VPELNRDGREVHHRRVIERRAAQVHVVVERREAEQAEEPGRDRGHGVRVGAGERPAHTLGPPRGAGRVDHERAERPRRGPARSAGAEPGEGPEAGHLPHREAALGRHPGVGGCRQGGVGEALVGDERPRTAVAQDVAELGGGQVPVQRHDVEAGLRGREVDGEHVGAVGQQQRHGVAGRQPELPETAADPVGLGGQIAVGDGRAAGVHDGGPLRRAARDGPQPDAGHAETL
jgi:hypothetical protein